MTTRATRRTVLRPERIRFVVNYPWGDVYITRLRRALQRLGLRTMNDGFIEGSDAGGFFVGADTKSLSRARRIIRNFDAMLETDDEMLDDERALNELLQTLAGTGVYEVTQDWKHLYYLADRETLHLLGVKLSEKDCGLDGEGKEVCEYTVRRLPQRKRRQRHTLRR